MCQASRGLSRCSGFVNLARVQDSGWQLTALPTARDPCCTCSQWLRRMIFLETVAGVPGMVAGVLRHLMSLRTMKRDHGW